MCDLDCTLHSDAIHDAVKLLQATHSAPLRFINSIGPSDKSEEVATWLIDLNPPPPVPDGSLWPLTTPTQDLMYHLPIPPTKENAELLRICTLPRPTPNGPRETPAADQTCPLQMSN
jgi:hypothetical protein